MPERRRRVLQCEVCQRGFEGSWSRFCSQKCRGWWAKHPCGRARQRGGAILLRVPVRKVCPVCCRGFTQSNRGGKIHCSSSCTRWWKNQTPGLIRRARALRTTKVCPWCRDRFVALPAQAQQIYCGRSCSQMARGEVSRDQRMTRIPWRQCGDCSSWFVGYYFRQNPRCSPCRSAARQALNRRKNVKRRGADVGESYTMAEIGDRDGWICHLCRRRVDRSIPSTNPQGPTIDHLVPVAAGGKDERLNVKLAHRSCNCSRRDGGEVQLLLVG